MADNNCYTGEIKVLEQSQRTNVLTKLKSNFDTLLTCCYCEKEHICLTLLDQMYFLQKEFIQHKTRRYESPTAACSCSCSRDKSVPIFKKQDFKIFQICLSPKKNIKIFSISRLQCAIQFNYIHPAWVFIMPDLFQIWPPHHHNLHYGQYLCQVFMSWSCLNAIKLQ